MGLLKALWDWLRGKADEEQQARRLEKLKEALPSKPPIIKEPPPPPIRKGSLEDIRAFTDEARKTIWILKKALNDHYQELGNLKDKIGRFLEKQK